MVSILRYNYTTDNKVVIAFAGEQSDTKPIDTYKSFTLEQGCTFLEIDTSKEYMLKADGTWTLITTGGGGGSGFRIEVVNELPTTGEDGVLYLVPKTQGTPEDGYYEYVWVAGQSKFGLVGSTNVQLGYFIDSLADTTVSGYSVPVITATNVTTAYNAFVANGMNVHINSVDSTKHLPVVAAFSEDSNPVLLVRFANNVVLTYTLSGNAVSVSLFEAQTKLESGTNIKTINGESVLGSGNIAVKTYQPVPETWNIDGTTEELIEDILADASAIKGMAYLDTIGCSDLPGGLGAGEAIIEIISGSGNGRIILIQLNSADTPPYNWEYNSFAGEWRPLSSADTVYDPTSINPQSGVAVAQAISEAVPHQITSVTVGTDTIDLVIS